MFTKSWKEWKEDGLIISPFPGPALYNLVMSRLTSHIVDVTAHFCSAATPGSTCSVI